MCQLSRNRQLFLLRAGSLCHAVHQGKPLSIGLDGGRSAGSRGGRKRHARCVCRISSSPLLEKPLLGSRPIFLPTALRTSTQMRRSYLLLSWCALVACAGLEAGSAEARLGQSPATRSVSHRSSRLVPA